MHTTHVSAPARTDPNTMRPALLIVGLLWLLTGAAARMHDLYSDDDWEGPYALFSVLLLLSAAATTFTIASYTSQRGERSALRMAAVALAVLGSASTLVAWAFPMWSVLLAAGYVALAATGPPHRRRAGWVGGALLAGLAVAMVAVTAELGPAGDHNDYSEGQSWGVTVGCVLAAAILVGLSRTVHAQGKVGSAPA